MEFRAHEPTDSAAMESLMVSVFSRSEGEREGALIGNLARDLIASTPSGDLYGFVAVDGGKIVAAIILSRLTFEKDIDIFILAVITYGDPAFYCKVGFHPLSQDMIAAPFNLSQPAGWLGQSLTDEPLEPIPGACSCVKALDSPVYW